MCKIVKILRLVKWNYFLHTYAYAESLTIIGSLFRLDFPPKWMFKVINTFYANNVTASVICTLTNRLAMASLILNYLLTSKC